MIYSSEIKLIDEEIRRLAWTAEIILAQEDDAGRIYSVFPRDDEADARLRARGVRVGNFNEGECVWVNLEEET